MERLIAAVKAYPPVAQLLRAAQGRPRLAAWITLSAVVCTVLAITGRDAALPLRPWLALFSVGILMAGLCIKIVTWEDGEDAHVPPAAPSSTRDPSPPPPANEHRH
jgi:uncharacterized membrane protein